MNETPENVVPLVMTVPAIPMSLNAWSRTWQKRHRQTDDWKWLMLNAFGMQRRQWVYLHGVWFKGPVHVRFKFSVAGKKRMDLDNLVPKCAIDGMKDLVFSDDNIDVLRSIVLDGERLTAGRSYTTVMVSPAR